MLKTVIAPKKIENLDNILPARIDQFIDTLTNDIFPRYGVELPVAPQAASDANRTPSSFEFAQAVLEFAKQLKDFFKLFDGEIELAGFIKWGTNSHLDVPIAIIIKYFHNLRHMASLNGEGKFNDPFLYEDIL